MANPRFDIAQSLEAQPAPTQGPEAAESKAKAVESKDGTRVSRAVNRFYGNSTAIEHIGFISYFAMLASSPLGIALSILHQGDPVPTILTVLGTTAGGVGLAFSGFLLPGPRKLRRSQEALERYQNRGITFDFKAWLQEQYGLTTAVEMVYWTEGAKVQRLSLTDSEGNSVEAKIVKVGEFSYELRRIEDLSPDQSLYFQPISKLALSPNRTPALALTAERS